MQKQHVSITAIFCILTNILIAQTPSSETGPASATYKKNLPSYNLKRSENYQRVYTPFVPVQDPATLNMNVELPTASITTQYFDQLGRPLQAVSKKVSPEGYDLVTPIVFDEFGRSSQQYMPYVDYDEVVPYGLFKANALTNDSLFYDFLFPSESVIYSEQVFEASPRNRVINQYAPGNSWGGAHKGIAITNRANKLSDSVRVWQIDINSEDDVAYSNAYYNAGELAVQTISDERGVKTVIYKDASGHKILTKSQLSSSPSTHHTGWLCTYYVYDEMSRLRAVISPKAVGAISGVNNWNLPGISTANTNLCYSYYYDNRGRVIMKRIPGKGKTYLAYDLLDRLVMTQDENLRNSNQWNFTKYDSQNRPVKTGLITTALTKDQIITGAAAASDYPVLSGTYSILSETYYDNYSWTNGSTPDSNLVTTNINSTNFITTYNTSPDYAQALTRTSRIRGKVTGTKTMVLGSSTYLYSLAIYDENGQNIQSKQTNYTGGTDVGTLQYSFNGRILRSHLSHTKGGTGSQTHTLLTKYSYDVAGRLTSLLKNIDGGGDKIISTPKYNELGQLDSKSFGNILGYQSYSYNIRGWLNGINKDYVEYVEGGPVLKYQRYFGETIAYDYGFTNKELNGNIAGIKWKAKSDGVVRAYAFTYDNNNRLTKADFNQQNEGSTSWTKDKVDFSLNAVAYDVNGNINKLLQRGLQIATPVTIDSLTYSYFTNSNQISKIRDSVTAQDPWGDFKDTSSTNNDYVYDENGNIVKDNNKHIHTSGGGNGITYNFLDKTDSIVVNGKGSIAYVYDAAGSLLQKTVTDTKKSTRTVITYVAGFVYQKILPSGGNPSTVPDTLQYVLHEEGRIRNAMQVNLQTGAVTFALVYDYFLKDHLGNVRSTITDEQRTDGYPVASLEAASLNSEKNYYTNLDAGRTDKNLVPGYPNDTYTPTNSWVQKLNGNGSRIGAGILLKVMAGDKLTVRVSSWYNNSSNPGTGVSPVSDIITALQGSIPGASADKFLQAQLGSSVLNPSVTGFLNTRDGGIATNKPKAFLNIVLLDEQLNPVNPNGAKNSYFEQVGTSGQLTPLGNSVVDREMTKSGYVYIYVSNETPNIDVFFDNLQVTHKRGALLQEQGYYPFGLEMKGISSNAATVTANNYKFNAGTHLEESFDVDYYETYFRNYDAQIGRFSGVDLLAEAIPNLTPYHFGANDPIFWIDPWGLSLSKPKRSPGMTLDDVLVSAPSKSPKDELPRLGGLTMEDGITPSYFPLESSVGGGGPTGGDATNVLSFVFTHSGDNIVLPYSDLDQRRYSGKDSWLGRIAYNMTGGERSAYRDFHDAYWSGTWVGDQTESNLLFDHFVSGNGSQMHFYDNSYIASLIKSASNFTSVADYFEQTLLNWLTSGNVIENFDGNTILAQAKPQRFSMFTDLYMATIMGGFKKLYADVSVLSPSKISITYRYLDHFGAGVDDSHRVLVPGLTAQYFLQHYWGGENKYRPFIWDVSMVRILTISK